MPRKVAILPRGIAIAARKWRFGPLCDLNSCEHGLHTQLGHPITCTALGSHIGSMGWVVSRIPPPVTPPRQREAPPSEESDDKPVGGGASPPSDKDGDDAAGANGGAGSALQQWLNLALQN